MKNVILLNIVLFVNLFSLSAQNDTMYVMRSGVVVGKYNVHNQVDSIIFYQPFNISDNTFTDSRDGYVYRIVTIGNQVWMAENLKYLPSVTGPETGSETTSYYYVYGYDGTSVEDAKATTNYGIYGVLYNWTAAMEGFASSTDNPSGVKGVCPTGWHLPSDAEWEELIDYLGGVDVAGYKMKETGIEHWDNPNTGANNESNFTALPGGIRYLNGSFLTIGNHGYWWSATMDNASSAWHRSLVNDYIGVYWDTHYLDDGLSVRCVKD
ncbi:FISUMP domain-containing protein [Saccharicrinis sp. FJH62]|uniref:FISUMP domain-containing protein n=1 Tax=Saccharicrinis sp. FJH62 TaxID=3344657 RepID=UPI0035D4F043